MDSRTSLAIGDDLQGHPLAAGAAGSSGATGAGSAFGIGRGGELVAHLGGATTHQFVHLLLAAGGAIHLLITSEQQLFKLTTAILTTILKNGHITSPFGIAFI